MQLKPPMPALNLGSSPVRAQGKIMTQNEQNIETFRKILMEQSHQINR